jgi:excisionase family DNA binding protein
LLLLTIEQAARLLQISRSGLYGLLREQSLRAVKVGGLTRIARADLETFVNQLRDGAASGDQGGEVDQVAHVSHAGGGRARHAVQRLNRGARARSRG